MTIDLKQLAILTSAYTGMKVWPNEAEILAFCQSKMGGTWNNLRQIRVNAADLKEKLKDEWTNTWTELYVEVDENKDAQLHESNDDDEEAPKIERKSPKRSDLVNVVMQLDETLQETIREEAEAEGITFDELIERIVKEKFAGMIKVEV